MLALNHSSEFIGLSGFPYDVWKVRIVTPISWTLEHTSESAELKRSKSNKSYRLSTEDRILLTSVNQQYTMINF